MMLYDNNMYPKEYRKLLAEIMNGYVGRQRIFLNTGKWWEDPYFKDNMHKIMCLKPCLHYITIVNAPDIRNGGTCTAEAYVYNAYELIRIAAGYWKCELPEMERWEGDKSVPLEVYLSANPLYKKMLDRDKKGGTI